MKHKISTQLIFVLACHFLIVHSDQTTIKIGALFDTNVDENKRIFQYAIAKANENLLSEEEFILAGEVADIVRGNDFSTSRQLCAILEKGISAVFGPEDTYSSTHAANICDTKDMPYIDTRFDAFSVMPVVNMYPAASTLSKMLTDLVLASRWKSFTILYEQPEWLPRVAELLEMYDPKGYTITVRRLEFGLEVKDYRAILRRVKMSSDTCVIIECSIDILDDVLKQAQQIGILIEKYSYIIVSLDAHTIDLEPYQYSGANITVLRMVDASSPILESYAEYVRNLPAEEEEEEEKKDEDLKNLPTEEKEEEEEEEKKGEENPENPDGEENPESDNPDGEANEENEEEATNEENPDGEANEEENKEEENSTPASESESADVNLDTIRLQTALLYDGVQLLADTFKQLGLEQIQSVEIYCNGNESMWEKGTSISNFMRNTMIDGITKSVKFDENGLRSDVEVQIFSLDTQGLVPTGTWSTEGGITRLPDNSAPTEDASAISLKNRTFIVLTSLTPPYGMLRDSSMQLVGNDRFEGFGIDVIHELSLMLGFKYQFQLQEDGVYGSLNNVTKEWNGMIRALQDQKADLAITDLTITSERESGADFTMPFMNLGIQILYQKPSKEPPSTFSFMSPFSGSVWLCLGLAYFTVSICLFFLGRLAPSEWDNPFPCCIAEPTELENQFTFANSMWFCIGALLQQGSEIAPKAPATRITAAIWWFFTLIMVSSYTANLAAFLTIENPFERIKSVDDLKDCGNPDLECPVKFGAKKGGATFNFFKDSEHPTYRSMYRYMVDHPELMTSSNDQGLQWAKEDNYAFLMESSSIEYLIERNCEVTQVGGLLDDKGYGIAMRKNSEYRNVLSEGVLRLQESGKLAALKIKWWKEKKGGGACSGETEEGALALEMANVEGVFYVLAFGLVVALIFAFIAISLETRRVCNENEDDGPSDAQSLNMENVNGVFLVLFGGCAFAIIGGYIECCILCFKNAKKAKIPFKDEFVAEMKFILKFEGNTKLVRHGKKSESVNSKHSVASYRTNPSENEVPANRSEKSFRGK